MFLFLQYIDVTEASPEEIAKRQVRVKMREEYIAALQQEGNLITQN